MNTWLNPFTKGERVTCTSSHADNGKVGEVLSVNGDNVVVKWDGQDYGWSWHWTHMEAI